MKKYRDAGGDIVHVLHDTPEGAPLFTPKTELAEEFSELSKGSDKETVSSMALYHSMVQRRTRLLALTMDCGIGDPQAVPKLVQWNRFERSSGQVGEEEGCACW